MVEKSGNNGAQQGRGQNEWHDIENQGVMVKATACSERTLKTLLSKQSSPSAREGRRPLGRDGRQAKAEYRKRLLKYLEGSDDVKVCIAELQERLSISEKYVFPCGKWPSNR